MKTINGLIIFLLIVFCQYLAADGKDNIKKLLQTPQIQLNIKPTQDKIDLGKLYSIPKSSSNTIMQNTKPQAIDLSLFEVVAIILSTSQSFAWIKSPNGKVYQVTPNEMIEDIALKVLKINLDSIDLLNKKRCPNRTHQHCFIRLEMKNRSF